MIALNFAPPPVAHDAGMQLAQVYLAAAVDPVATQARLQQLNEATQAYRAAIDEHAAVSATADQVTARETAVATREQELPDRENGLIKSQTQLQVASNALASRDEAVKLREQASDRREIEIAARAKALDDRLAAYRQALA